jgi:hypothetical protein
MTTSIIESRNDIIQYLDTKLGLYLEFRKILYSVIDTVHYSPSNLETFKVISEVSIRMDELHQLKMRLTEGRSE